jgi:flagellar biosynthesis component FlhA
MKLLKTDDKELIRDSHSKALLNTNRNELLEYRKKKALLNNAKEKEKTFENRLTNLETDMTDIKNMLAKIFDELRTR